MYFFASAIIIYEREKNEELQYIKSNKSIKFILDHYPSKLQIENMFDHEQVLKIDIMCVQEWSQEQYDAYE